MRRADRLFLLVQLLRARRVSTAEELAAELGVSKRTVYRDIRDLEASGVPVEGEAGVGYRLHRGFELPPMTFTPGEIEALVLGARMVEAWGDDELGTAARAVLTKVGAVLPPPLRPVLDDAALFAIPRHWRDTAARGMADLRRAIHQRHKLNITYVDVDGAGTERIIHPLGLYFWGMTWTLAAWCELRGGYRSFRPDRIDALQVSDERYDPDHGPNLAGFLHAMDQRIGRRAGPGGV
ncbi:MAG: YafY family transcriptional regulator [Alphaproteobacteria bacterium]|nr:YafY family transcriptional regulator [Alphaproteobacteria bacterium]